MLDRQPLTPIQQKHFDVIEGYCARKGYFPAVKEIQSMLEYKSPRPVQDALIHLEKKGWIQQVGECRRPRGYRIIPQCSKGLPVRPGALACYGGGKLKGVWTPAELLEEDT
jgi:SOS-response transcriptional repressor LexA